MFSEMFSGLQEAFMDFFVSKRRLIIKIILGLFATLIVFSIISTMISESDKIYLKDIIKEDNSCDNSKECLYTGNVNYNYVWYSGFLWRIIGITENNTIQLISDTNLTNIGFYSNESNNYVNSYVRLWLNEDVLLPRLNNSDKILSKKTVVCYGNEIESCKDTLSDKVGLLSYEMYEKVGGASSYLAINSPFWTNTTVRGSSTNVWYIDEFNELSNNYSAGKYLGVRPIINVDMNVILKSNADGTKNDPYLFLSDNETSSDKLNERNSGEYVKFAGKIWRIVDTKVSKNTSSNKYLTKLIFVGMDLKKEYNETDEAKFDTSNKLTSSAGYYLTKEYYEVLKKIVPKIDNYLETYNFSYGIFNEGDPYTNIYSNSNYYASSKIGLPQIGDLFTTDDVNENDCIWTMNTSPYGKVWTTNTFEDLYPDTRCYIRPVILLTDNVTYVKNSKTDGKTRETALEIVIK